MRREEEKTVGMKVRVAVGGNTMAVEAWIAIYAVVVIALVIVSLGDGGRALEDTKSPLCSRSACQLVAPLVERHWRP